jgi:hypothetical protein
VFARRFEAFRERLAILMVGKALATKYDFEKLSLLHEKGDLGGFLKKQDDASALGGWLGALLPYTGSKAVADHDLWPYFARRFRIEVVGLMEPKPGVPPTTQHLSQLVESMRQQDVRVVLAAPYYDPRHAEFVARNSGAKVVELAHQAGSRPGAADYLAVLDFNVRALAAALKGS